MKKENAITLIALVISIIVIIILAGVTINTLINNGIIDKAKTATQEYKNSQDYEEIQIAKYTNEIDSYINGNRNINLSDDIKKYIDEKVNGVELWANPTPNQAFTAQTVNIENIMTYKKIKIVFWYTDGFILNSEVDVIKLNQEGILNRAWASYSNANTYYIDHREFFIVESGIQFKDARTSQSNNNDNNRI